MIVNVLNIQHLMSMVHAYIISSCENLVLNHALRWHHAKKICAVAYNVTGGEIKKCL